MFDDQPYPASAIAATGCDVIALRKEAFFSLLRSNPDMHLKFSKMIAERLRYKSVMLKEITCFPAAHRILTLLKFYKNTNEKKENEFIKITQTRKQIALQTGLRVETVIRIIKQMETDHILTIKDGKIFI